MTDQAQLSGYLLQIHKVREQLINTRTSLTRMSSLRAEIIRIVVSTTIEGSPAASTREARNESSRFLDRATISVLNAWRDLDHLQRAIVFDLDAESDDSEHDSTGGFE